MCLLEEIIGYQVAQIVIEIVLFAMCSPNNGGDAVDVNRMGRCHADLETVGTVCDGLQPCQHGGDTRLGVCVSRRTKLLQKFDNHLYD